jgi:transketolase
MPCWELFEALPPEQRERVLPAAVRARVAVELGVAQGWHRWVGDAGAVVSVERFGASAPAKTLLREYGFTVEAVCAKAREVLAALKRS